jgi:diguanylate cyclase (GGDEF)-like protein
VSRIFISHSATDNAKAIALCRWLDQEGYADYYIDVNLDGRGLVPVDQWPEQLRSALEGSDVVLFLLSPAWYKSQWCRAEFILARVFHKRLLGALIQEVPEGQAEQLMLDYQYCNLVQGDDREHFAVHDSPLVFDSAVSFAKRGLNLLRLGLRQVGVDASTFHWPPPNDESRSPYPGLRAHDVVDAAVYFGRELEVARAMEQLRAMSERSSGGLFAILGSSGCGKSSFLRAGLLSRLSRETDQFIALPVVRPQRDAINGPTGLVESLFSALRITKVPLARAEIRHELSTSSVGLSGLIGRLVGAASTTRRLPTVIVPIDQAEELFTSDAGDSGEALLGLLAPEMEMTDRGAGQARPRVIALLTIRSDSFEWLQSSGSLRGVELTPFSLKPLAATNYRVVIEGPAARHSARGTHLRIDPSLTNSLVDSLMSDPSSAGALPLIALALERMYREYGVSGELSAKQHTELGGLMGVVKLAVDAAFTDPSRSPAIPSDPTSRESLLRDAFVPWLAYVDPTTGTKRRRVARQRDLPASCLPLIERLVEARLLVLSGQQQAHDANPRNETTIELAHECLIGEWPALATWLEDAAEDLVTLEEVRRCAADWVKNKCVDDWILHSGKRLAIALRMSERQGFRQLLGDGIAYLTVCSRLETQTQGYLDRLARFDELTDLPNRVHLLTLLTEAIHATDRDNYMLVVCQMDLDRFKSINDAFGHAAGDRILAELAGRLLSRLRRRDTWADLAARPGGDEFVLLLRVGTIEEAKLAVERLLREVSRPFIVDQAKEPVEITASLGATVYPIDRNDADTLLRHAEHAMYGAKQSGRNGYLFHDPELRRRTEQRVMAIGRVQEALDRSEFVLFYQPIVDMRSGKVLGMEALLRWEHPQQGMIAPLEFLPLIENTGLSARIGDWVLGQALDHLSQWRRSGMDITVNVNMSARQLQEPDFVQRLSELLARHAEPLAPYLELEMLQTAAHSDIDHTSALMARCREIGVRFALDRFGTGYSTLTCLRRLPADSLKIDRTFIQHMLNDSQDRAVIEGVVSFARAFSLTTTAVGVESNAQMQALLDLGCTAAQGLVVSAPMAAFEVAPWILQWRPA